MTYRLPLWGVTSHCSTRTCHRASGHPRPTDHITHETRAFDGCTQGDESSSAVKLSHLKCSPLDKRCLASLPSVFRYAPPKTILHISAPSEWGGDLHHQMLKGARSLVYIPWLSGFAEVA